VKIRPVLHFLGVLLLFIAAFMLVPVICAVVYHEPEVEHFIISTVFAGVTGFGFLKIGQQSKEVHLREGFAVAAIGWLLLIMVGALPYFLSTEIPSLTDAIFESTSGFTTTGASIIEDVEALPRSILFWRSFTHWLGGMGIIVLTIAILPVLGIGGMQLYQAEVPGPIKDKLTPRIGQTAKLLWGFYTGMTLVETALLMLAGMSLFDALCHSFGTVATGGFSTRNNSIAAFENPWIHWIIILFMFLAGTNFSLHLRAIKGRPIKYFRDSEFRFYMFSIITGVVIICATNWVSFTHLESTLSDVIFVTVSQATCTGFTTVNYELWHPEAILVLIVLMFMGGMVGSTSGGLKSMRCLIILRRIKIEIRKLVHPQGVYALRFNKIVIPENIISNIMVFAVSYILIFLILASLLLTMGLDYGTSFGATIACLSGVGPGIGLVGPAENYHTLPMAGKWVLIAAMYLGRLELMTVLVLFSRSYWRK